MASDDSCDENSSGEKDRRKSSELLSLGRDDGGGRSW